MEKIRLLLYCCKQPHKLFNTDKGFVLTDFELGDFYKDKTLLNGKIVAECDFEVEKISGIRVFDRELGKTIFAYSGNISREKLENRSCLNARQLTNYLNENNGYAIHIKNLHIFDESKELSDYVKKLDYNAIYTSLDNCPFGTGYIEIKNAPQNMMRVWVYEDGKWVMYILISVRPEWLFLELKGEKTIEVRKRVLKEML